MGGGGGNAREQWQLCTLLALQLNFSLIQPPTPKHKLFRKQVMVADTTYHQVPPWGGTRQGEAKAWAWLAKDGAASAIWSVGRLGCRR